MRGRGYGALLACTLVLAGLGAYVAAAISVTTDITHFLPGGQQQPLVQLARELTQSELSRTMVLVIEAPDAKRATAASAALETRLRADARVAGQLAFLRGGPPDGVDRALWDTYQPRTLAFVARDAAGARAAVSDQGLKAAAQDLRRRLALPTSTLITRVAPADPLLVLPRLFDRLQAQAQQDQLTLHDGRFVTTDGRAAVLFLATHAPAFDGAVQGPLLVAVRDAFDAVAAAQGGGLVLRQSGVNRFAVRAEAAIKADITRVSSISIAGLVLAFLLLFRSLRLVALSLLPVGAGMLTGTAACLLAFGQIHGLTLAFGAALIGVSIDYTAHFYCHHQLAPHASGPRGTLTRVWPGLLLGAATTVAGFVALAVSSFPGLRQLAVFGAVGLVAALLATRWMVPPLVPLAPRAVALSVRLAAGLGGLLAGLARRRWIGGMVLLGAVAIAALGLPRAHWNDDMSALGQLDPQLMAEDEAVRARVALLEQRRMVVAVGADDEAALQHNDAATDALIEARAAGEIDGYRNVAGLLPSAARQVAVAQAVRAELAGGQRFDTVFAEAGFKPQAFAPFRAALQATEPPPLRWDDLAASPLYPLVSPFRVALGDRVAYLSFLRGLTDADALSTRLDAVEGADLLDQQGVLTAAYGGYRQGMVTLLSLGLLVVLLLIAARYRDVRRTVAAFVPAVMAAAVTVGVLALLGQDLNLLTLTALLMVVSMGVDYGVFLAEAARPGHRDDLPATLLGVSVACLSTVLGFGLLALSDHPALKSLGLTAGVGVVTCVVLAPTVLLMVRADDPEAV